MIRTPTVSGSLSPRSRATRRLILNAIEQSNAAHIGSCFSVVEILSAVYASIDIGKVAARAADRDRVILSKGHAAAALYATLFQHGLLSQSDFETYHRNDSLLGGHVSHFVAHVEHSTGALGHGLPVAVGMAIGLRSKRLSSRVFVIVGDGELHEGANWEAIMLAGHLKLSNLCLLIDDNRMSQIGPTDSCCSLQPLRQRLEAFRFHAFEVDGHDEHQIGTAIMSASASGTSGAVICTTTKGRGASFMENNNLWHYRTPKNEDYQRTQAELSEAGS